MATSIRNTALAINSIVFLFFLCFFACAFFARNDLNELARKFVTEKTLQATIHCR